jgi:peptidylprolyl isomerase
MLNKQILVKAGLGLLLGCFSLHADEKEVKTVASVKTEEANQSETIDMTKLSEAFGHFIGRNLQSPGLKFDLEAIVKGIREGAAGKPAPLTEKEYEEMMAAVQERAFKDMSQSNLKSANDFMTKNKSNEGVKEIVADKLQFQVLKEGDGAVVEAHSSPKIHYSGKYQDGTVFGTSEEMGGPITIPLDQTIPGFSKGIVGMKEGEKRRLFVHPDLGYGTTGQLPPNELLIFDIELVKANSEDLKNKDSKSIDNDDDDDEDDLYIEEEDFEETSPSSKKIPAKG